ncbi:MAG: carboxypeptidase regulatory-like domain-containing protein, partial [Vicinamibacteria bacterium]
MSGTMVRARAISFLAGVLLAGTVSGQQTAGSVAGVARDPSLAVLPGVTIVIRNADTGVQQQTVTNEVGTFNLPVVPVGRYSFSVELAGFKTATGEFVVELNRRTNLNIVLELGAATETVQVVAAAPVETTDTQVGDTFETRLIIDLPTPSQDVNSLALLSPNVVDVNTTGLTRGQLLSQVSSPVGGAVGSVGGSRARNNSFNVDGVDNNDPIVTGPQGNVIQDAVAEFTILKSNFNAEFGQATGGQFNIVTKSGTNDYAGNVFWYHQDRHLNSTDFLTETAIESGRIDEKPPFDLNRFGGTFGGPLVSNELFFFGAYEYEKVNAAGTTTNFVFPTEEGFNLLGSLPPGTTRFGAPGAVSPFVLDFIRRWGLVAPQANLAAARFPLVLGVPIPVGAVSQNIPSFSRSDRFMGNLDWQAGANDRWQFRFFSDFGPDGITAGTPKEELNADRQVENYLASASWVHTFSPDFLNDFRLAFHRQVTDNVISDPAAGDIPNLQVAEIALSIGPSGAVPSGSRTKNLQIYNSSSYATDRHLWKFGIDFRDNGVTDIGFVSPRGNYRYVNFEDLLTDIAPTQIG